MSAAPNATPNPTVEAPQTAHATFVVDRTYPHPASRVFFALSDQASTRRWRVEGEGFEVFEHVFDFRVGGQETSRFRFGDGPDMTTAAQYQVIIPDRRIVFSYRMTFAGEPMSVCLVTVDLTPAPGGTRMTYTEQGVYFGDPDGPGGPANREEGTRQLLESLAAELARVG